MLVYFSTVQLIFVVVLYYPAEKKLAFLVGLSEQEPRLAALYYLRRRMFLSKGCTGAYRLCPHSAS